MVAFTSFTQTDCIRYKGIILLETYNNKLIASILQLPLSAIENERLMKNKLSMHLFIICID